MLGKLLGWSGPPPGPAPVWAFSLVGDAPIQKLTIRISEKPATFARVFQAWREDSIFRSEFSNVLANIHFAAFRWELPGLTTGSTGRPFECVLIDSPSLLTPSDPSAFSAHFSPEAEIVTFPTLGGDATLVVPCPLSDSRYGHLRAFLQSAPDTQKHKLWQSIGSQMDQRLNQKPVWLNTAGGGVPWLHIRLDDQPKYYRHEAYR